MAEDAAPFDNIDSETASLILQLQLADVQELRDRSKDKQRHGELTDDQVALSLLEQDLERVRCVISDRQMTQSIADAVRTDAEAIAGVVQEEEVACEDHTLAHRLNGSDVTSAVRLQSDALNEQVLARLAGQYISEDMGHELFDGTRAGRTRDSAETTQAESSAEAAHRGGRNPDPRRLQCVACSENKAYLDVIEVVCGHAYCIPCLQELIDLATKDETLFPPRCCKEPFNMSEVGLFLTKELRDQFDHAKVEFGTRDRTYCSETNCSAFILPDRIEQDTATCPKCLTATCVICKQGAHGGDCPDDPALRETLDLALQNVDAARNSAMSVVVDGKSADASSGTRIDCSLEPMSW
ncbi:hypothetical protein H2200_010586 [Cladophialophora chaetospira]|uniref:IBR domain-containing protein n=1 Tax=Cladophialophora chaetospira TaxID=386627 RepID=A0AA39CED8_9EURO|nr:hypothetical protein H2200_010586 [Cladophialophora chaetospira]